MMTAGNAASPAPADLEFVILRGDPDRGLIATTCRVPIRAGMTVLEALNIVWRTSAPDLAFRWSCRIGRCLECLVSIDGQRRLACRVELTPRMVVAAPTDQWKRDLVSARTEDDAVEQLQPITPSKGAS